MIKLLWDKRNVNVYRMVISEDAKTLEGQSYYSHDIYLRDEPAIRLIMSITIGLAPSNNRERLSVIHRQNYSPVSNLLIINRVLDALGICYLPDWMDSFRDAMINQLLLELSLSDDQIST